MPTLQATRDDVVRLLGEMDDEDVVEILALTPSVAELEEAAAWLAGQGDAVARKGHPLTPRVSAIVDIASEPEDEETAQR